MIFDQQDIERRILGYMLCSDRLLGQCRARLEPIDFVDKLHQQMFSHLREDGGFRITVPRMVKSLRDRYEHIAAYTGKLSTDFGHFAKNGEYFEFYLSELIKNSKQRQIQSITDRLNDGQLSPAEATELISKADQRTTVSSLDSMYATRVHDTLDRMESERQDCDFAGYGWKSIDSDTGGIKKGESIIIAAQTGFGKTTAALSISIHNCRHDRSIAFVSMEMSADEINKRVLSSVSNVTGRKIFEGDYSNEERQKMIRSTGETSTWKLGVYDRPGVSVRGIYELLLSHKKDHGLDVVVVDYIQLIVPENPKDNPVNQLSQISRDLKIMARQLDTRLISLCQFNRAGSKADKASMYDLKGSSALEQDADVVMLLEMCDTPDNELMPWALDAKRRGELVQLRMVKNRRGLLQRYPLVFDREHYRMYRPDDVVEWEIQP